MVVNQTVDNHFDEEAPIDSARRNYQKEKKKKDQNNKQEERETRLYTVRAKFEREAEQAARSTGLLLAADRY